MRPNSRTTFILVIIHSGVPSWGRRLDVVKNRPRARSWNHGVAGLRLSWWLIMMALMDKSDDLIAGAELVVQGEKLGSLERGRRRPLINNSMPRLWD